MKKVLAFWVETFFFYKKNGTPPSFVKPLDLSKWSLCEKYSGTNLNEKGFQFFQLYSIDTRNKKYSTGKERGLNNEIYFF